MRSLATPWSLSAGLCMAALSWGSAALAQPLPDNGGRLRLLEAGSRARDAGDHAGAIVLFEQAGRIEMRPGLRTSLAQEYEAVGRHREACETASRGVDDARAELSRPENGRALQGSAEVAAVACRQVGLLHLRVPADALRGLHVLVQGRTVDVTGEVTTVAVDPGVATVQMAATDGRTFRQDVTVQAGETGDVVAALRSAPPVPAATAPAETALVATAPIDAPTEPQSSDGAGVGPWIVGGAGVVALGLAGVFYGVLLQGAMNDRDSHCHANTMMCDPAALDAQAQADSAALLTNVTMVVGLAALAGGGLWYLLGRGGSTTPERTAWTWDVGPMAGGAMLRVGGTL